MENHCPNEVPVQVLNVTTLVGAFQEVSLVNEPMAFMSFCNCTAALLGCFFAPAFGFSSIFAFRMSFRS